MRVPYVVLSLRTYEDTVPWSFGRRLLEILCAYPQLRPERVGSLDIDMDPFKSIEAMEQLWARRVLLEIQGQKKESLENHWWERKWAAKSELFFSHTFTNVKNEKLMGSLILRSQYHKSIDWRNLFIQLCTLMKPRIGMLHIFTDDERSMGRGNQKFPMGHFDTLERSGPCDFGWFYAGGNNYYNKNYYDEIMGANLVDTDIMRVDHGGYATLEIAKGEDELFNDFEAFAARRELLKERLPIIAPEEPKLIP